MMDSNDNGWAVELRSRREERGDGKGEEDNTIEMIE